MYKLSQDPNIIIRISDGTAIPKNTHNTAYQEYLKWIDDGNLPESAAAVIAISIIPAYVFRDRFTEAELIAINALAYSGDAMAQLLLLKVSTATDGIDLMGQSVADGLNYLASVGAITSDRLTALKAPL
jgi:hypothetical protein